MQTVRDGVAYNHASSSQPHDNSLLTSEFSKRLAEMPPGIRAILKEGRHEANA
jgi:hypothetical protein